MKHLIVSLLIILNLVSCDRPTFDNNKSAVDHQADSLLSLMTLDEKLGQMVQSCFSTITLDGSKTLDLNAELFRNAIIDNKVGSFLSGTGSAKKWIHFVTEVQKIAIEESRLGIPLIIGIDHVHGANYVDEGTIFPHNLTLSCSFDTALIAAGARVVAKETAPLGLNWNFAPVFDVGKNVHWPRLYETFGEDPLVCGALGSAFVRGYQSQGNTAACAKHFVGYSDPKSGWDRTSSEIPDQILYEYFLPPFAMGFDAGVKTVMVNSGDVNGEAVHGSSFYLQDILRKRMRFDGVVLTDIRDIKKMVEMHHVAHDYKEALAMAMAAGIDMTMACNHYEFAETMKELLEEGRVTEARIDESVRRILKLKYELDLFKNPYPEESKTSIIGSEAHYLTAVKAAEQSIVLLKNDNILPLKNKKRIVVAGFAADSRKMLNGPWTLEWLGAEEGRQNQKVPTIYTVLQSQFGEEQVTIANKGDLETKAANADYIVLTIGERPYSEFKGNINDIHLDQEQKEWLELAKATKKPIILILVTGRPRVITQYVDACAAILFAGYPGHGGALALTNIISGQTNPSGKLSFSYPSGGSYQRPYYYRPSEVHHTKPDKGAPLYSFGHGLSYADFVYENLTMSDTLISANDTLELTVSVTNQSDREVKEIVLWYIKDEVGKIARPVKQLKQFSKVSMTSREQRKVKFTILPKEHLSYPDKNGNDVLEAGYFIVSVGTESKRFKLQ